MAESVSPIVDKNNLSIPALRELLLYHDLRNVIRHFESRGFSLPEIYRKIGAMYKDIGGEQ
jgi:hypothetical protein